MKNAKETKQDEEDSFDKNWDQTNKIKLLKWKKALKNKWYKIILKYWI